MFSEPALCVNSIDLVGSDIKCKIFVCVVFWRQSATGLGFPLLYSEICLFEWVYCMFPFFSTFYLWHLGQPPHTHSVPSADAPCEGPQWSMPSPAAGDFPWCCTHLLQLCVCACVCLSVRVFCPLFGGLPDLQTEGEDKNWQWKFKLHIIRNV